MLRIALGIASACAAIALVTPPAAAQVDLTDTGGNPLPTQRALNITASGQTKPPSRDASPTSQLDLTRRSMNDANQDAITTGICIGCSPR
jgi:hypothetical protein